MYQKMCKWIIRILQKMGKDPETYLQPVLGILWIVGGLAALGFFVWLDVSVLNPPKTVIVRVESTQPQDLKVGSCYKMVLRPPQIGDIQEVPCPQK